MKNKYCLGGTKGFALLSSVFLLVVLAYGQFDYTNNVSRSEATRVASGFWVGMWEEQASKILATNRLTNAITLGNAIAWGRFYELSDGTSLHLDYRARSVAKDGKPGGNGELQKAFIQSNRMDIIVIALTNAPDAAP